MHSKVFGTVKADAQCSPIALTLGHNWCALWASVACRQGPCTPRCLTPRSLHPKVLNPQCPLIGALKLRSNECMNLPHALSKENGKAQPW